MRAILVESVDKLGRRGDVVDVKGGYFRNFLQPRGKAEPYNASTKRVLEEQKKYAARRGEQDKGVALSISEKLQGMELCVKARVGSDDRLFGSVTKQEIARALADQGFEIDKRKIDADPIKKAGTYTVKIRLRADVESEIQVKVVKE